MNLQTPKVLKEISGFEEDSKWFYENADFLRKNKFIGKFVAIKNKEVIASDKELNKVVKEVENKGKNPSYIVIEYVYPEGTIILL